VKEEKISKFLVKKSQKKTKSLKSYGCFSVKFCGSVCFHLASRAGVVRGALHVTLGPS